MPTRREFLKIAGAGLGSLLVGVGAGYYLGSLGSLPATVTTAPTTPKPSETYSLSILGRDAEHHDINTAVIDFFTRENPSFKVDYSPLSYAPLYDKMVLALQQGSAAYDLVYMDDPWLPQFGERGWLTDLEALAKETGVQLDLGDFPGVLIDVGRSPYKSGKIVAIPQMGNVQIFAYRKDVFDKLGLPEPATWSDVLNACEKIKASGLVEYPVAFRGVKGNPVATAFQPILYAFGGKILSDDLRKSALDSKAVEALEFFLQLKKYAPPGVENFNTPDVRDRLVGGRIAMSTETWPGWVKDADNPALSKVPGLLAYTTTPGERTKPSPLLGVWYWGIPAASQNKAAALKFILYSISARMQKIMAILKGLPPVRISVGEDKELAGLRRWIPVQVKSLNVAVPRPRTPLWPRIEDIFGSYVNQVLAGVIKPSDAVSAMSSEIDKVLSS
ncbi:MAG TPA: extracellular solute-binding protein [Sulfolobales archaeon]|nr:extracellular solute-binding protein [Sulfolobales archaeon]